MFAFIESIAFAQFASTEYLIKFGEDFIACLRDWLSLITYDSVEDIVLVAGGHFLVVAWFRIFAFRHSTKKDRDDLYFFALNILSSFLVLTVLMHAPNDMQLFRTVGMRDVIVYALSIAPLAIFAIFVSEFFNRRIVFFLIYSWGLENNSSWFLRNFAFYYQTEQNRVIIGTKREWLADVLFVVILVTLQYGFCLLSLEERATQGVLTRHFGNSQTPPGLLTRHFGSETYVCRSVLQRPELVLLDCWVMFMVVRSGLLVGWLWRLLRGRAWRKVLGVQPRREDGAPGLLSRKSEQLPHSAGSSPLGMRSRGQELTMPRSPQEPCAAPPPSPLGNRHRAASVPDTKGLDTDTGSGTAAAQKPRKKSAGLSTADAQRDVQKARLLRRAFRRLSRDTGATLRAIFLDDLRKLQKRAGRLVDPRRLLEMVPWYCMVTGLQTGLEVLLTDMLFIKRFDMRQLLASTRGLPTVFSMLPKYTRPGSTPESREPDETPSSVSGGKRLQNPECTGGHFIRVGHLYNSRWTVGGEEQPTSFFRSLSGEMQSQSNFPFARKYTQDSDQLNSTFDDGDEEDEEDMCARDGDIWFDFVADTGDGFNPMYAIARAQAQPKLYVETTPDGGGDMFFNRLSAKRMARGLHNAAQVAKSAMKHSISALDLGSVVDGLLFDDSVVDDSLPPELVLPRAKILFHGGDLAYPHPNKLNYISRFMYPYNLALAQPRSATLEDEDVESEDEDALQYTHRFIYFGDTQNPPGGRKQTMMELSKHQGPLAFMIPGNHDWYDNLDTFVDLIVNRPWFGGWYMPQETSYFIVQLSPHWHVFGMDTSLTDDLDMTQFLYFKSFVEDRLLKKSSDVGKANGSKKRHRVIVITHKPNWSADLEARTRSGPLLMQLLHDTMKDVLALRLCGDLHHYSRFMPDPEVLQRIEQLQGATPSAANGSSASTVPSSEEAGGTSSGNGASGLAANHGKNGAEARAKPSRETAGRDVVSVRDGLGRAYADPQSAPPLVVCGGGGAFSHPNPYGDEHMLTKNYEPFEDAPRLPYQGYRPLSMYPTPKQCRALAWRLPLAFRDHNCAADFLFGLLYVMASSSIFPLCEAQAMRRVSSLGEGLSVFLQLVWVVFSKTWNETYISLIFHVILIVIALVLVAPEMRALGKLRWLWGLAHYVVHALAICCIVVILEVFVDLSKSWGNKAVVHWPPLVESVDQLLFAGVPVVRWLLECVINWIDVPLALQQRQTSMCCLRSLTTAGSAFPASSLEQLAGASTDSFTYMCNQTLIAAAGSSGAAPLPLTRWQLVFYKLWMSVYLYAVACPCATLIMGVYLSAAYLLFQMHSNHSFVALRDENYKSFIRFKIDKATEKLTAYVIGIENCAAGEWQLDDLARRDRRKPWCDPMPSKYFSLAVSPPRLIDRFELDCYEEPQERGQGEVARTRSW